MISRSFVHSLSLSADRPTEPNRRLAALICGVSSSSCFRNPSSSTLRARWSPPWRWSSVRRSLSLGNATSFSAISVTSTRRLRISVEEDLIRACRGPRLAAAMLRPARNPSTNRIRDCERAPICSISFCENTKGGETSCGQLLSRSVAIRETSIRSLPLTRVMEIFPSPSTPNACSSASLPIASDEDGARRQKRINSITELFPVPRPPIRTFKPGDRVFWNPSRVPPLMLMDSIHTPECLPRLKKDATIGVTP